MPGIIFIPIVVCKNGKNIINLKFFSTMNYKQCASLPCASAKLYKLYQVHS